MGDLWESEEIGGPFKPVDGCPTPTECQLTEWCKGGCHTASRPYLDQFQPVKVHFHPDATAADYETIVRLLTTHPAISKVDIPTGHNLSVAVRRRRRNEP